MSYGTLSYERVTVVPLGELQLDHRESYFPTVRPPGELQLDHWVSYSKTIG